MQGGVKRRKQFNLLREGIRPNSRELRNASRWNWARPIEDDSCIVHGLSHKREKYGLRGDMRKLYGIVRQEG
jgi:hypothetical protein